MAIPLPSGGDGDGALFSPKYEAYEAYEAAACNTPSRVRSIMLLLVVCFPHAQRARWTLSFVETRVSYNRHSCQGNVSRPGSSGRGCSSPLQREVVSAVRAGIPVEGPVQAHRGIGPVPGLEVEAQLTLERDGIQDVEAVHGKLSRKAGSGGARLGVIGMREQLGRRPGVAKIVLGAGAEDPREVLAVDVDLLVALAPPGGARRVLDVEDGADQVAVARQGPEVPVPERSRGYDLGGVPAGVEEQAVGPERTWVHVDQATDRDGAGRVAVAHDRQDRLVSKGHGEATRQPAVGAHGHGQ